MCLFSIRVFQLYYDVFGFLVPNCCCTLNVFCGRSARDGRENESGNGVHLTEGANGDAACGACNNFLSDLKFFHLGIRRFVGFGWVGIDL